jgi:hypothetical protein
VLAILTMIITQPYTYFGSGGAVGDRYFMGFYGACIFLMPPVGALWGMIGWAVGALFIAKAGLHPFETSLHPWETADSGPLRVLPVELTNINDLPIRAAGPLRTRIEYGDTSNVFQLNYLDANSYLREADRSFWIKGESRAEVVIKANPPFRQLKLTLSAGPVATSATVRLLGRTERVSLSVGESRDLLFDLVDGFPYKMDRPEPTYLWVLSISSSAGFFPQTFESASPDTRYLGVRVKPIILP